MKSLQTQTVTQEKTLKPYLQPDDICRQTAEIILNKLNSFDTAENLNTLIQNTTNQTTLCIGDVHSIMRRKGILGEFQNLQQVAAVRRIGSKKFDILVRALGSP